jgi:superfamily I DNA and/or RNA helicase
VEIGKGDYLTVEVERTAHPDMQHQLRFGMLAAFFSNHNPAQDRLEGIITHISGNKLKISLRVDELPDWTRSGKLGIDAVFDENSYAEMETALKRAPERAGQKEGGALVEVLTGNRKPRFDTHMPGAATNKLNSQQQAAVQMILAATDLAIVHGPPGTGKTTTLVQAIKAMVAQDGKSILVTAPSNTAVDLLSEKLAAEGLNVVRVGNPARVNERQMALTLDSRMAAHASFKEIKKLKRQASEYRDLAQKYKRSFGKAERDQRKALFAEARSLMKEVERTEDYIAADVLSKAQVITATLVGANHYTVKHLKFETIVIDEAGQALEPACWIPVLKAQKVVMAGDHCQLPPVIKSMEAAAGGLRTTLMEKCVAHHPEAVVLLEEQYRMNKEIMGFSSQQFYEGRLQAHASVANRLLFENDSPLLFIDTAGCGYEEQQEGTSTYNPEEARFLLKHLDNLMQQVGVLDAGKKLPSVAVISPYKHQVAVLKELVEGTASLLPFAQAIQVNTIDSFQGQERDIVYISMTRSNSEGTIGFLSDIRRMNVAMTRARKKLVVIGDSATLAQDIFYADFITYAQGQNAYVSAWEFMDL